MSISKSEHPIVFPKKGSARKKYRQFVEAGIGKASIWPKVRGQILLGEDDFVDKFIGYLRRHEDIKEIPRSQRYIGRPSLNILFKKRELKNTHIRNKKIAEAAESYGYSQKEIADYLKMHYSTISRLIKNKTMSKNKT